MAFRSLVRVGVAVSIGSLAMATASVAKAAVTCEQPSPTCSVGTSALSGTIAERLAGEIDSGWMDKGLVKIRTRFAIAPVKGEPLFTAVMPAAIVEASWSEKGSITPRPRTGGDGSMNVRYTLEPRLDASIYGVSLSYDATELLAKVPGSSFGYDAKATNKISGWGFAAAKATAAAPALDQSTIFSLPFSDLGISTSTATRVLAIQAVAKPTFVYRTKEVLFDSASVTSADGSAKLPAIDADALDVGALVSGELSVSGTLDVRPVVRVDTAYGVSTFGLVTYSFSVVSKSFDGEPTPVSFERAQIHIPLPNVKAPTRPVDIGSARAGDRIERSVTIDNTGEMEAVFRVESSDPRFTVPSGELRIAPKSQLALPTAFAPSGDGPAAATITVRSNDPDSPEQTFRIAANGAPLEQVPDDEPSGDASNAPDGDEEGTSTGGAPAGSDGCTAGAAAPRSGVLAHAALVLGLVASIARRRSERRRSVS